MNSRSRLRELFEFIRAVEEQARDLYSSYLARVHDPEILKALTRIRGEEAGHVLIAEELLKLLRKYEVAESQTAPGSRRMSLAALYALSGAVLGLGAPLGSFGLRFFLGPGGEAFQAWLRQEFSAHAWYYLYMGFGTMLAFSVSGFLLGHVHDRLRSRARDLTVKARLLEDLSAKDSLTGLYNFGTVRERLEIELERSKRFETPLSCLMLDLDNLKDVNDRFGHTAGDAVLRHLAKLIQSEVRVIDTATRYGGDEFFIILPVTSRHGALAAAERICKKARAATVDDRGRALKLAVSVGVATYPEHGIRDAESLVLAADTALYEAKRGGGDRAVCAPAHGAALEKTP